MKDEQSELIIKYLQGQLDTQGMNDFYAWVSESAVNKKVFFEIKALYDACTLMGCRMIRKKAGIVFRKKERNFVHVRKADGCN